MGANMSTVACQRAANTCLDVWNIDAGGHTCGDRIIWLVNVDGENRSVAEKQVASEFPDDCGPCAVSGAITCREVWQMNAHGHTCGDRILWLVDTDGKSELDAQRIVG